MECSNPGRHPGSLLAGIQGALENTAGSPGQEHAGMTFILTADTLVCGCVLSIARLTALGLFSVAVESSNSDRDEYA